MIHPLLFVFFKVVDLANAKLGSSQGDELTIFVEFKVVILSLNQREYLSIRMATSNRT